MQTVSGAIALAVRTINPNSQMPGHREDEAALLLADGSVWTLERILVPVGAKGLSLRAAAWSLKRERMAGRVGFWCQAHAPRAVRYRLLSTSCSAALFSSI